MSRRDNEANRLNRNNDNNNNNDDDDDDDIIDDDDLNQDDDEANVDVDEHVDVDDDDDDDNDDDNDDDDEDENGVEGDGLFLNNSAILRLLRRYLFQHSNTNDPSQADSQAAETPELQRESDEFLTKQHAALLSSRLGRDVRARTALSHVPAHRAVALRQCGVVRRAEAHAGLGARFLPARSQFVDKYAHQVFCGKFSKSGALFMSACQDRHIRLYDTASWRLVKDIVAQDVGWSIISVDYAPDDRWVIYSSWSDFVHLYNTRGPPTYERLNFRPSTGRFCLFSSEFSPNSTEILAGASDHNIYLYDLERKERTHSIRAHGDDVNSICWLDQSGQLFASGSDDRLVLIWDRRLVPALDAGDGVRGCVGAFVGHTNGLTCVSSRGDGRHLLSNGKDHCAKLWDVRNALSLSEARTALHAMPNSYADYRQSMRTRRRGPEAPLRHTLDRSLMTYRGGHQVYRTLLRAHFSPLESTGSRYVIAGSDDGTVCIYETLSGDIATTLGGASAAADGGAGGHAEVVRDVSWHPFKPEIVTTAWDGTCRLWTFAQHHELDRKRALNEYSFRARPRPTRNNVVDDDDDDDEEYQG